MSDTQAALIGAGGSRWITNPKQLNKLSVINTAIAAKTSASTFSNSSSAAFFTALALRGAQTSIATANTYVTVASLTGAGFLVNCISPTHTAAFTPTMRITVDGTQYVIAPSAAQTAAYRMLLGPVTASVFTTSGDSTFANSASDNGFSNAAIGGLNQISGSPVGIITPETALVLNLQVLRFETSLLVEMKCDLLSGVAIDKQCGATYVLDL